MKILQKKVRYKGCGEDGGGDDIGEDIGGKVDWKHDHYFVLKHFMKYLAIQNATSTTLRILIPVNNPRIPPKITIVKMKV